MSSSTRWGGRMFSRWHGWSKRRWKGPWNSLSSDCQNQSSKSKWGPRWGALKQKWNFLMISARVKTVISYNISTPRGHLWVVRECTADGTAEMGAAMELSVIEPVKVKGRPIFGALEEIELCLAIIHALHRSTSRWCLSENENHSSDC